MIVQVLGLEDTHDDIPGNLGNFQYAILKIATSFTCTKD